MSEAKFCDVSNHQPSTQAYFQAMKDWGAKSVVIKITEGSFFIDPTAKDKIASANAVGLKVHAYHFFHGQSIEDSKDEARYFSNRCEALGLDKESTIMVNDIEAGDLSGNASTLTSYCNAFYDEIDNLGWKKQDTYSSSSWFQNRLIQSQLKANNFWCASYGAEPNKNFNVTYNAWQYSADENAGGEVTYIAGVVTDCNIDYNGFYTSDAPSGGGDADDSGEVKDPAIPETSEELEALFEKILNDATLKKSTLEYCTSLLGFLSMGQIFDKPPWLW